MGECNVTCPECTFKGHGVVMKPQPRMDGLLWCPMCGYKMWPPGSDEAAREIAELRTRIARMEAAGGEQRPDAPPAEGVDEALVFEEFGGAEGVYYAVSGGRYTARIVVGRVWRWQVGDTREPARLAARTTRGFEDAREACALAVRLLELVDAGSDVPPGRVMECVAELADRLAHHTPDRQEAVQGDEIPDATPEQEAAYIAELTAYHAKGPEREVLTGSAARAQAHIDETLALAGLLVASGERQERERKMPPEQIGERMREAMAVFGVQTGQELAARAMELHAAQADLRDKVEQRDALVLSLRERIAALEADALGAAGQGDMGQLVETVMRREFRLGQQMIEVRAARRLAEKRVRLLEADLAARRDGDDMITRRVWRAWQEELAAWQARELPGSDRRDLALGVMEELGEVARCLLKGKQDIRGGAARWHGDLPGEMGDVMVFLMQLATACNIDMGEAFESARRKVLARRFATKEVAK